MASVRQRKSIQKSLAFIITAVSVLCAVFILPAKHQEKADSSAYVRVVYVVDGDTFKIDTGEKVRMLGIDTPEMHESAKLFKDSARSGQDAKIIQQMGQEAKAFVVPLIEGKPVRLEFDIQKKDKYGRLLAYVFLEDGTFLNKYILEKGFASPLTIPPNVKYADDFKALFKVARSKKLGLWKLQKE